MESRQANVCVRTASGEYRLVIAKDESLRTALDATHLRVRAACGGVGSCGVCGVRLLSGTATPLTRMEYQKFTADERAQGWRLSCQMRLNSDAEIWLPQPARPSPWSSIPSHLLTPAQGSLPRLERAIYGVAVDLGTSHIRVALLNRKTGQRIASRQGPNPQGDHGADVLNRLHAAARDTNLAKELAQLARSAIFQALCDMLRREIGEVRRMLEEIGQVLVVGNSAMLSLLAGQGGAELLDPQLWQRRIRSQSIGDGDWHALWRMPNAEILLVDPVAGFIGSDLLADLLATRLADSPAGALLLDVGTNTEVALWDGRHFHVSSVPGGPAFEGVGISHGMAAGPGAIDRVDLEQGRIVCDTINHVSAEGICGSGLVDAVAVLLEAGHLQASGRFIEAPGERGFPLQIGNPKATITGSDVDTLQQAKAAVAAALAELLSAAQMDWQNVKRLCLCGAFGHTLNVAHAQQIGLLPTLPATHIELHANTALAGCEHALLDADGIRLFAELSKLVRPFNLAYRPSYTDRFIDHLRLRPIAH